MCKEELSKPFCKELELTIQINNYLQFSILDMKGFVKAEPYKPIFVE